MAKHRTLLPLMGVTDPLTHSSKCTRVSCWLACFSADTFIVDQRMSTTVRLSIRTPIAAVAKREKLKAKKNRVEGFIGPLVPSIRRDRGRFYLYLCSIRMTVPHIIKINTWVSSSAIRDLWLLTRISLLPVIYLPR